MVKKKKKSSKGRTSQHDMLALITELFRAMPDKRYSIKNLVSATAATTRQEKDDVRAVVRSLLESGTIELAAEGKYRLSRSV